MTGPMLRERIPGQHARVSFLELFFDLVFVFAVTQISHALLKDLTWAGALRAALLMFAVWWAWIYTAWITNWLNPENTAVRAMMFVLMALGLVMSTSLPDAFDGRAPIFAAAYVASHVGRTAFMIWAVRRDAPLKRNFQRVIAWKLTSAVFWFAGAGADSGVRLAFWGAALAIEYAAPAAGFWVPGLGRTPTRDWTVEGGHMAERCGLFIIICLGESILVTGATFAGLPWTPQVLAAFAAAFGGAVALWWIYFSIHADAARDAISASDDPGRIARLAYTYAHIPMIAGVITAAAGDELVLAHPTGPVGPATAWVLIGGPALFLLGALWFKYAVFGVIARARTTGLLLLVIPTAATPWTTPLGLSVMTTGVLTLVGAWEAWASLRAAARPAVSPSTA